MVQFVKFYIRGMFEKSFEVVVGRMVESLFEIIKKVGYNIGKLSLVKYLFKNNIGM